MLRSSGCGEWPYPSCQLIPYRRRESATTKMTTSAVATRMLVRSNGRPAVLSLDSTAGG